MMLKCGNGVFEGFLFHVSQCCCVPVMLTHLDVGARSLRDGEGSLGSGGRRLDPDGAVAISQAQHCLCLPVRLQHSHSPG